ncbi:helix-turn-helix domain-containing protein, partial [Vibrio anguillarum]
RERQLEGIAAAKAAGKYKGRKPLSNTIKQQVITMHSEHHRVTQIARELAISRNSVYKILNEDYCDS